MCFKGSLHLCILVGIIFSSAQAFFSSPRLHQSPRRYSTATKSDVPTAVDGSTTDQGAWLPVGCISSLSHVQPNAIELAGKKYVVWKSQEDLSYLYEKNKYENEEDASKGWSVLEDYCAHRMAPLSEGRVDKETNCIECPYHGWQFETDGKCASIPQLEDERKGTVLNRNNDKTTAHSLKVYTTTDVIWAYVPLPSELGSTSYDALPDVNLPILNDPGLAFTMRDLPYSFDFLVENFMDPAHIPFAHHSLQAVRSDGSPIPMKMLTEVGNATHCEVSFVDVIRNKTREGVVSFTPPCYYHFRTKDKESGEYKINLIGLVMPVSPGRSRLILALAGGPPLIKKFPKFISHMFSNRFLDTDVWVHDQELRARGRANSFVDDGENPDSMFYGGTLPTLPSGGKLGTLPLPRATYSLVSQSDLGCSAWRQWWAQHMSLSSVFGVPRQSAAAQAKAFTFSEKFDRYSSHVRYCVKCQGALKNAGKVKKWAPIIGLFVMACARSIPGRLSGVALYWVIDNIAGRIIGGINGPQVGDKTSAAQL